MKRLSIFSSACLALLLAGCSFPAPPDSSGAEDLQYTRAEQCTRACDRGHTICMEPSDTRFESYGEPRGSIGIGMAATCDADLKDCLKRCAKR